MTTMRRSRAMAALRAGRTTTRCSVCGFTEVFTDEVLDRGAVLLAECPRCDHRWTECVLLHVAPQQRREALGGA
jgi:uncharacterized Zn finger protein